MNDERRTMNSEPLTLLQGNCLAVLKTLPDECVQCCVTSPPYYGLRDYGTAEWQGGSAECDHFMPPLGGTAASTLSLKTDKDGFSVSKTQPNKAQYASLCAKCGARRRCRRAEAHRSSRRRRWLSHQRHSRPRRQDNRNAQRAMMNAE